MIFVKYKLFCYMKYSSVPDSRGRSDFIFSKISPPLAFNNYNDDPKHVSPESQSFRPCTKAGVDFV